MPLLQKREDHSAAATYWVCPSHVGLIDEVFHDDLALTFVAAADKREDVADAEETVRVKEPLLVISGKVGGENAICGALSALVFAGGAGLVLGLSNGAGAGGRLCRSLTVRVGVGWGGGVRGIHDERYLDASHEGLVGRSTEA